MMMDRFSKYKSQTGDGSSVGMFFRAPGNIDEMRGSLGVEDESPAHTTFLHIGNIEEEDREGFFEITRRVLAGVKGPIEFVINDEVDVFKNDDFWVAHQKVRVPDELSKIRTILRDTLVEAGISVDDKYDEYVPHITLEYMEKGSKYEGSPLKGKWVAFGVEVWGLPHIGYVTFKLPGKYSASKGKPHKDGDPHNALTLTEVENREIERLVRPEPKIYPSRDDSKRNVVNTGDNDLKRSRNDEKDLSKNYKHV